MKSLYAIVFAGMFMCIGSCKKDGANTQNPVPIVSVNRQINMNNPQYDKLNQAGGVVYLDNEGYKGIIVVHSYSEDFYALDRACPYHPDAGCAKVEVDNSGLTIKCGSYNGTEFIKCCESEYALDGNILKGPSQHALRSYFVTKQGTLINITN